MRLRTYARTLLPTAVLAAGAVSAPAAQPASAAPAAVLCGDNQVCFDENGNSGGSAFVPHEMAGSDGSVADLSAHTFLNGLYANDNTSSITGDTGWCVEASQQADFRGPTLLIVPGSSLNLPADRNDTISSARFLHGGVAGCPSRRDRCRVCGVRRPGALGGRKPADGFPPGGTGGRLARMTAPGPKTDLLRSLQLARDALVWKLDGLSEYDVRRPLTPTGTNLLGLVKHAAGVELGYLGEVFGRPSGEAMPWLGEDAEPNADMWATADESRERIVSLYRRAWAHADATLAALPLDAVGRVPHWPDERAEVTLHHAAVRVLADTQRHAGHADVLRELLDGAVGLTPGRPGTPQMDGAWWRDHHDRLERAAVRAARTPPGAP